MYSTVFSYVIPYYFFPDLSSFRAPEPAVMTKQLFYILLDQPGTEWPKAFLTVHSSKSVLSIVITFCQSFCVVLTVIV